MSTEIAIQNSLFNADAEQDILAALIVNNQSIDVLDGLLQPEFFYFAGHQKIYKMIVNLITKGSVADTMNITHNLASDQDFLTIGAGEYLEKLITRSVYIIPLRERAGIVYDLFVKRRLFNLASKVKDSINSAGNADLIAESIEKEVFELRSSNDSSASMVPISNLLQNLLVNADKARKGQLQQTGIPTGFSDLDALLSGLNPSDLIILAARPSMGKTALAINIAYNIAVHQQSLGAGGVVFFSLEMSSDQIATRVLSMVSGVSSTAIRTGRYSKFDENMAQYDLAGHKMTESDFIKLQDVVGALNQTPLFIDDTPAISTSLFRTKARMLKKMYNISAIVVDYLQLMKSSDGNLNNRVLEISEITQTLKAVAKELQVPIIALSQLSRQVEARDDKHPQLSDLRESGSIEQDADIVMFIYREEYYLEKAQPKPPLDPSDVQAKDTKEYNIWIDKMYGKPMKNSDGSFVMDPYTGAPKLIGGAKNVAELIIAKHRNGPVGSVRVFFDKNHTLFSDLME